MDEATSSLDYENERRVFSNLINHFNTKTVFFITHRLSTIKRADLILFLHKGVVEEIGSHDELMSKKGRYYSLYKQQED